MWTNLIVGVEVEVVGVDVDVVGVEVVGVDEGQILTFMCDAGLRRAGWRSLPARAGRANFVALAALEIDNGVVPGVGGVLAVALGNGVLAEEADRQPVKDLILCPTVLADLICSG